MNRILTSLFLLLIIVPGCSRPHCGQFKTGTFTYGPNSDNDVVIERTKTRQIESSKKEGFTDEYQIIWHDQCEYQLVLQKTDKPFEEMEPYRDTMKVKITETKDKSYTYIATLKGKRITGTLHKK